MKKKLITINEKSNRDFSGLQAVTAESKVGDIAIIGLDCKFGGASDEHQFWEALVNENDLIRDFPNKRKEDVIQYLQANGVQNVSEQDFLEGAYLDQVDEFDYTLFGLSPKEASLLDPNQRIILQSSWNSIENAGYAINHLKGTQTGVYLGFSNDFGEQYKNIIQLFDREAVHMSIAGNVKSIIASRIAYHFDFRGPAILFDTACSSSLVAIHHACTALKNGDCEMALAGGVKIHLVPTRAERTGGIGIYETTGVESKNGRTQTFNEGSDGTGIGEGVAMVVLKPLKDAIRDNDNIRAVIKGGSINQDGSSIGITAPNSEAQEKLILKTWKEAGVKPEEISYIEAHGTGTRLGDPVEINGLTRAFRKITDKKQFCGIGSVKTNIGHLDNVAGIAGLVKVLLCMEQEKIPPLLHFTAPNKEIDFEKSPFYVVNEAQRWEKKPDERRIAGISSFGLSGTNCHMILQDYEPVKELQQKEWTQYLLPISANSVGALINLVKNYEQWLKGHSDVSLINLVATASIGRVHQKHRLLIKFNDYKDLQEKIVAVLSANSLLDKIEDISYASHQVLYKEKEYPKENEFTEGQLKILGDQFNKEHKKKSITDQSITKELITAYCLGLEIDWARLYATIEYQKESIPTYSFDKHSCWIQPSKTAYSKSINSFKEIEHPLLDECLVKTENTIVFNTEFSVNRHWELRDHKIKNDYLLPGTAYIEMIYQASFWLWGVDVKPSFSKLIFINPLKMDNRSMKNVQTVFTKQEDQYHVIITSRNENDDEWEKHVECMIQFDELEGDEVFDVEVIKNKLPNYKAFETKDFEQREIETGDRWHCANELFYSEKEYLVKLNIPDKHISEAEQYFSYPSLLDSAVNAANFVVGDGLFLPFSYKKLTLLKALPSTVYSYFVQTHDTQEIKTFDIKLIDDKGHLVGIVDQYSIKRVSEDRVVFPIQKKIHQLVWKEQSTTSQTVDGKGGNMVVVGGEDGSKGVLDSLSKQFNLITIKFGAAYRKEKNQFTIPNTIEGFEQAFEDLNGLKIYKIIHACGVDEYTENSYEEFREKKENVLNSMFNMTKALLNKKVQPTNGIVVLTKCAQDVDQTEKEVNPINAALQTLANVCAREYAHLIINNIDIDDEITDERVLQLLNNVERQSIAVRHNQIYKKELQKAPAFSPSETVPKSEFNPEGVYVITGGLGGLGFTFAKSIGEKFPKASVVLLVRKNRSEFDEQNSKDRKYKERYEQLIGLNDHIHLLKCDITNEESCQAAISKIDTEIGSIHGVIHAAGIAGDGYLIRKEKVGFDRTVSPKIDGTWILLKELEKVSSPQWIALFSSITSFLCEPGQCDYAGANAYLNALVGNQKKGDSRKISINWSAWREIGMAVDYKVNMDAGEFKALSTQDALDAFDYILQQPLNEVIVGETNNKKLTINNEVYDFDLSNDYKIRVPFVNKQEVKKVNINQENILEVVTNIWVNVLGLDEIDEDDNFYDLGGNSILATQMLKEYEQSFPGVINVADVFSYTTINAVTQFIREETGVNIPSAVPENTIQNEDDMDSILEKLSNGNMQLDEATNLINI